MFTGDFSLLLVGPYYLHPAEKQPGHRKVN